MACLIKTLWYDMYAKYTPNEVLQYGLPDKNAVVRYVCKVHAKWVSTIWPASKKRCGTICMQSTHRMGFYNMACLIKTLWYDMATVP